MQKPEKFDSYVCSICRYLTHLSVRSATLLRNNAGIDFLTLTVMPIKRDYVNHSVLIFSEWWPDITYYTKSILELPLVTSLKKSSTQFLITILGWHSSII
jgi:hypothetical protein